MRGFHLDGFQRPVKKLSDARDRLTTESIQAGRRTVRPSAGWVFQSRDVRADEKWLLAVCQEPQMARERTARRHLASAKHRNAAAEVRFAGTAATGLSTLKL
eukprot:TRINITY_DN16317_c0_g2_i1.p2 TRINITY_DN16317_c0_g2~~TRINITY_DN16317_c0_g2_i1.p2  ORF type:complete len:102 (-),score=1.15 TRINITY_DN16317_c0_g2_i1:337-642(-)